jgi:hypothetical protein
MDTSKKAVDMAAVTKKRKPGIVGLSSNSLDWIVG